MKFEINNLNIDKYNLNFSLNDSEKVGVFSRDKKITEYFLELLSGINRNNNTIIINGNSVFDNKEYFKSRIYLDFSKRYLTSLRVNKIEEKLKNYNLTFDKDRFINICKELNVRGETHITYQYEFTDSGNTFLNLALLASVDKQNVILNNPTINLKIINDLEYFSNLLTSEYFENVILGLDNLSAFKNKLDKVIFFSDFKEVVVLSNFNKLIVFDKDIDKHFLIKDKLFKGNKLISYYDYSRDELRNFQKYKVNYELITIYDLERYLD